MANNAKNVSGKSRLLLVALEPRLVFDGALALTDPSLDAREPVSDLTDLAKAVSRAVTTDAPAPREASARREIVFIDDSVAELQTLIEALGNTWQVVQVRHSEDGLAQMNAALVGRGAYDAIHILAHGQDGVQTIGATQLSAATLDALKPQLATLGASLKADGDLLLYGCEVAQTDAGQTLVRTLAQLTGADVAASVDRTGASGNWTLEQSAGAIETQALAVTEWQGDLAIIVTGTKVNEGSPFTPFTVTGLVAGQSATLGVADKTTTGMVDANIKYSFDNGATWTDYNGSITAPTGFTATSKLLVAVADTPETKGSIAIEGSERYQLAVNALPASISFQLQTDNFLVAGESEQYTTTQVAGTKGMFGFNGTWAAMDSFTRNLVLGGQTIGTVTFPQPTAPDEYGGANGSKFVTASDATPVTINLKVPQNYFGFWWSAGDDGNILEFYKGGQLVETFKADLMNDNFPAQQLGNPYAKYDANDNPVTSTTLVPEADQANSGEKYAFLNFFMKGGKSFDKIVMRGSNFEFDNLTFLKNITSGAVGDGSIIDDGTGAYIKLDAAGNPVVDSNGNYVTDPNAFVDNDHDNTPSASDCWYVGPINLLANDVASSNTRSLNPASIKLYSSLTASGTGEGGQTLATALGEFKVTPTGVLYFNPNAGFNGDSDRLTIYYTVADSSGSVSSRAAVYLNDPSKVSDPTANNGAVPVTTPWRQTNANATELFNLDANSDPIIATRTASGSSTSLTVDLSTNSDNDAGDNTVAGSVQAKLKIDTTTNGSQLTGMGLSIPASTNFGDFVDLGGLKDTTNYTVDDLRGDPYATKTGITSLDNTLGSWRSNLGAAGGVDQTDATKDYYTSQQVNVQQDWFDFDPMRNAWVKFETGNLNALNGKSTTTAYQIGTITVSFQNPNGTGLGADNPLIHLADLGGAVVENKASTRGGYVGAQLQMVSASDANGNAISGASLSKLSGNLGLSGNLITSNTVGENSYGTVKVNGTGVASVTFNVLMKGKWEDYNSPYTTYNTYGTVDPNTSSYNEQFYLSTSTFIGPDKVTTGTPQTGAAADAMNRLVSVCGVSNVVVNEGSPYAIFKVGGFEGSQLLNLSLSSGTGDYGVDTGTQLQYFDPSANGGAGAWLDYTDGPLTIPENGDGSKFMPTELLVRVAITNDAPADNGEQLTLRVQYPTEVETGTLTIKDDGTGNVFGADNTTGNPDPVDTRFPHTALNDDVADPRPITINSLEVNEASPYAIFTVTGKEGQTLSLGSLTSGTGTAGVDTGPGLEYFNGSAWVPYTPGQSIRLGYGTDNVLDANADASLLVRVAITKDTLNEISETLTLSATPNGGSAVTGTLTIVDRNNGSVFATNNTNGLPDQPGAPGVPEVLDDDTPDSRPVTINDITVNEGSPFAVFTVGAAPGQRVLLGLPQSGSADVGTDTGTGLEYFNGTNWVAYIPGTQVETPASGKILVRVSVVQDAPLEGPQTFTISASNANGDSVTGTGTIVDDGTGTLFGTRADNPKTSANEAVTGVNPDGTPVVDTATPKDDDRPIAVNSVAVNEASPYIVFTVSGAQGQSVKLSTGYMGSARVGTDTSKTLEYFDGTNWVSYTPGSLAPIASADGNLLVRLAVTPDSVSEGTEKFNLIATSPNGKVAKGVGSISDDGTGVLFGPANTTGVPDAPGVNGAPLTLWQDGAPPQSCWNLEPIEITQGLNLAFNEYVDPASIDLDPATAGQQTSRDMFDSNNVKLGSYVASPDGTVTFVATSAFRGTSVGAIDIALSVKSYAVDSNNQIVLNEFGEPVPSSAAPRVEQHKVAVGASRTDYVPTGTTYTGPAYMLVGGYLAGTDWAKESMYLTRAMIDNWIDPADKTDTELGITRSALIEAPAPIKFYDPATGVDRSEATLQKIKEAFLPAYQAIEPGLDSVAWILSDFNGRPGWNLFWYNSRAPQEPLTNWAADGTTPAERVGRGFWLVSQPESSLSGPKNSGLSIRGDFWGNPPIQSLSNAPVLRPVHTFGVALTEVCGVNNVTVNEGSPYAIFEVGGFEGNRISALQLSSGTGTLGVDTASTLQYFNGTDWVNYVPGQPITIPSDGDTTPYEATKLLVRVAITNDDPLETVNGVGETLTLKATYAFASGTGPEKTGTLTILDNGTGQVFGSGNTTGTPDNIITSTDPTVPEFLDDDYRPPAPELCWSVPAVNIADKVTVASNEALDFSTVDFDVFTPGRQTSRTVQVNGVDVGTYTVNSSGQVRFSPTKDFRGQAPEVIYNIDVVSRNTGVLKRTLVEGVGIGPDRVVPVVENTVQGQTVLNKYYVKDFQSYGYKQVYIVGAVDDDVTAFYPGTTGKPIKVWDETNGFADVQTIQSELNARYLPIVKQFWPTVDSVQVAKTVNKQGDPYLGIYFFNSQDYKTPLKDQTPVVMRLDTQPNLNPSLEGHLASLYDESANLSIPYATNVPVQGMATVEVCGVSSVVVNEGSPWAVFQVGGFETGTIGNLELSSATGTAGLDTGAIEYFNGSAWVPYTGGPVTVPDDGDRNYIEPTKLLVRVAIQQDPPYEVREELKLTATYSFGAVKSGTLTILDDGTGSVFGTANTTATPDVLGTSTDPSLPARLDDDRPLSVNSVWAYEGEGHLTFTVTGAPGQPVSLALQAGSAALGDVTASGIDAASGLEFWNPAANNGAGAWQAYTPGSNVTIPAGGDGTLRVRVAVAADATTESPETLQLVATNASGRSAAGTGTILDGSNPVPYPANPGNVSGCFDPVTLNVLANDPSPTSGSYNPTSLVLYAAPGATGVKTLVTDYGTYQANNDGTVTFTPAKTLPDGSYFNGVAPVVYYAAKDTAGNQGKLFEIHIGDGVSSSKPGVASAVPFNGVATEVTPGLWSISGAQVQGRTSVTGGGTNLVVNGDFTPEVGAVPGYSWSLMDNMSKFKKTSPYAPIPGWSAEGGGALTYAMFGTKVTNEFDTGLEPTGADSSQVYFGNSATWVYKSGDRIAFNADGVGLDNPTNPILLYTKWLDNHGDYANPVKISQTISGLEVGQRYRLQFWQTSEKGYQDLLYKPNWTGAIVGYPGYSDPGIAALEMSGYDRVFFKVNVDTNPVATLSGTRYTIDFLAKDPSLDLSFLSWGHVKLAVSATALNPSELALDDVILSKFIEPALGIDGATVTKTCGINDVVVNEASPWAVFTVNGVEGQRVKLDLLDGTGVEGVDTNALQYLDPTDNTWKPYTPGLELTLPNDGDGTVEKAQVLVRVGIVNDTPFEQSEQLKLQATFDNGLVETGTLTILDDGKGYVYLDGNKTASPSAATDTGYPAALNDDRGSGPQVNSIVVNEGSPYAVFTLKGVAGAGVSLTLGAGSPGSTAELTGTDADIGQALEFWNASTNSWVAYNPAAPNATIGSNGQLLVRVAVVNDAPLEVSEDFTLTATYNNKGVTTGVSVGASSTGQGVIKDDGTGTVFAGTPADPLTGTPAVAGVDAFGNPQVDTITPKDIDALNVSNLVVNEGSPYAVFSVGSSIPGAKVTLALGDGKATSAGGDYTNALEVWNPTTSQWDAYTGQVLSVPSPDAPLLVRTALGNQTALEGAEPFKLTATLSETLNGYPAGVSKVGTATILDDGRGDVFSGAITPATSTQPATPVKQPVADTPVANPSTQTVADDDRPLTVNNVTVNEGSPFAVFTVGGVEGQYVKLGLTNGTATVGTDTDLPAALEYWNGTAWTAYTPGTFVKVPADGDTTADEPAKLLVRVPIKNDTPLETSETFKLQATNTGGTTTEGIGTIKDDGTGDYFATRADDPNTPANEAVAGVGPDGLPVLSTSAVKDDDRPLSVNNVTVNEASPNIVFTVTGKEGQLFSLDTVSGTAVLGQDTGTQLQYLAEACRVAPTTLNVLANDVAADGKTLDKTTVRLFSAASGGTGTDALTIAGQGTWKVNDDGTVTFNPVSGLAEGTPITPVYYSVKDNSGAESGRSRIVLSDAATSAATAQVSAAGTVGRYVRIEQSNNYLALSEVQVFSGGTNIAQGKVATQSTTGWGGVASRAVDGNTSGNFNNNTVTHTNDTANPWWEVDLASAVSIDQITIWNRDSNQARLSGATVKILDANRNVVTSYVLDASASQTEPFTVAPATADDGATPLEACGYDWVDYTPGARIAMPDNGNGTPNETAKVLVRLAVKQDLPYEVSESFQLQATNTGGAAATGIGTIVDDGTGQIFASPDDNPDTPANEAANPDGTPVVDNTAPKDDDRPLTVKGSTVREPGTGQEGYLPFTVSGIEGQPVKLALKSDSGTVGTDTGTQLEYWNGTDWDDYDPANPPTIPQVGSGLNGETGTLQVRVALTPDNLTEGTESVSLVATNRNGTDFSAPGYILEGAGTTVPDVPAIAVTGQTVNEASPYLVYKVSGLVGQDLSLNLAPTGAGTGHVDTDADISCQMPMTTLNVLANDVVNTTIGDSINPGSVLLFSTGAGGAGVKELLVSGQGTYKANADGTVSFTPVDGLDAGTTLTPIYYTVKTNGGAESAPGKIDLNPGAVAAAPGTPQTAPWWQVDLGADVPIDSIKVFNRTDGYGDRLNGASVLILNAAGQVVQTLSLPTPGAVETLITAAGTSGRYVKIQLPAMGYLHIAEAEVFSNGSNIASGKPATQSSTGNWDPRGPAELAVDGNTDGHYFNAKSTTHTDWTLPPVTANDGTPGGTGANLACQELEYFDGTNWVSYVPGSTVKIPGATTGQPGELLVRARVVNDGVFEGPETLDLVATSVEGYVASGTGTIVDDGTGLIYTNTVTNGAPVPDVSTPRNDDRGAAPVVNSFTVNEASPFGVFTVTGVPGAGLSLALSNGTAEPEDHGTALEFFDMATSSWKAYTPGTPNAVVQPDGRLLVRVAINNDAPFEGPETFNLTATYNGSGSPASTVTLNGASTGTATIVDDGSGQVFLTRNDDPLTPENDANLGVTDGNRPQFDDISPKDDDRGVAVSDVTVNEGSPYIVFSLDSFVGQKLQVSVSSGTATLGDITQNGVDASSSLEYWNGIAWVAYTPGSSIDVTAGAGDVPGAAKSVLVRMAVKQDAPFEMSESFTLTARTATGKLAMATGTILDNGSTTGVIFGSGNPTNNAQGNPVAAVDNVTAKDDDRPYNPAYINDLRINEGSPWAVFTITGVPTAQIALSLPEGTAAGDATKGTDYANGTAPGQLQVYIQTASNVWDWVDYNPDVAYPSAYGTPTGNAPGNAVLDSTGKLLVRVKLENQLDFEGDEPFGLSLQYTGNWSQAANLAEAARPQTGGMFTGYANILDDGTGMVFGNSNSSGTPTTPGTDGTPALLDDDRPLVVGDATVNEGSPYIVMPVTGKAGQLVKLELASGTATLGTVGSNSAADASDTMEYWNGSSWVAYTDGSYVQILTLPGQRAGAAQTLLVRMVVANDTPYERSESFTLTATNTGGTSDSGTGSILDKGDGTVFATGVPGNPSGVTVDPLTNRFVAADLPSAAVNDDRPVSVDSVHVNEGSPFAVFTVTAVPGEPLLLSLASGTAQVGTDTRGGIEYFDATAQRWLPYVGLPVNIPANGTGAAVPMLVRVGILVDPAFEGDETFTLQAQYANGNQARATGIGTISDDGTGDIYASLADNLSTPANEAVSGVNSDRSPAKVTPATAAVVNPVTSADPLADDDRPVTVGDVTVNEGSPFAVFTVRAKQGQYVALDLVDGTATAGADYVPALQYWNGDSWENYAAGSFVKVPGAADGVPGDLLVRVAIKADALLDGGETFTLTATNTGGAADVGTGTIQDDGTGTVFLSGLDDPATAGIESPSGVGADRLPLTQAVASNPEADPALEVLADDDRPVVVNSVTVNEASPYLVWTVGAKQGQYVRLDLGSTQTGSDALLGTDTDTGLEYWNGAEWESYNPGTYVKVPGGNSAADGRLRVRVAVTQDDHYERSETLSLSAFNVSGSSAVGTGTIVDNGTGVLFTPFNMSGLPDAPGTLGAPAALDDDRPLLVHPVVVNEASPFMVFTLDVVEGEPIGLELASGTATVGTDTGSTLEYWNGASWVAYNGSSVTAPGNGDGDALDTVPLLVRVQVKSDTPLETSEVLTLKATYLTGQAKTSTGTGTIVDDGTGTVFLSGLDDPATPGVQNPSGVANGLPLTQSTAATPVANPAQVVLADDDRPLDVNNLTVNEGSPFAVFTVGGREGQYVKLELAPGTATSGSDYANSLEVWNGSTWEAYTPGTFVMIPADGDPTAGELANLLVRVAINADTLLDGGETFTLTASNTGGTGDVGTGTIVDNGTGTVFLSGLDDPATPGVQSPSGVGAGALPLTQPTAATPVADPAQVVLADDDRPVAVNDVEVNEASPYLIWTVDAKQGQYVRLALGATQTGSDALLGTDTGTAQQLQYWNGSQWRDYTPGTFVKVPGSDAAAAGTLLVRVQVYNDYNFEDRETLTLSASNTGGVTDVGVGVIRDDGKGLLFGKDNTTAVPDSLAALGLQVLDDDRVAPPVPQPAEAAPPPPEPAKPQTLPALHVQMAVSEGRQAVSPAAPDSTAGVVAARAVSGVGEGKNVLRRTEVLIDKFDRVTDPNLYVLPEVKSTRGQSFDAALPSITLQSGLLASEIRLDDSQPINVKLSQADGEGQTLADRTLAEMSQEQAQTQEQPLEAAQVQDDSRDLARKLNAYLAAAREAARQEQAEVSPPSRGQMGFSRQLQLARQSVALAKAAQR